MKLIIPFAVCRMFLIHLIKYSDYQVYSAECCELWANECAGVYIYMCLRLCVCVYSCEMLNSDGFSSNQTIQCEIVLYLYLFLNVFVFSNLKDSFSSYQSNPTLDGLQCASTLWRHFFISLSKFCLSFKKKHGLFLWKWFVHCAFLVHSKILFGLCIVKITETLLC